MPDRSPHCIYLASAGTGKTHQLTNQFIALLNDGEEPHSILATTFTRKAAGEILARILTRLSEAATTEKGLKDLRDSFDPPLSPALTRERCADLTATLARQLHRLNIGTIDSFFADVLHGFALDLAVPAHWTIIKDEPDADLRALAVTHAVEAPDRDAAVDRLRTLVRMLHKGGFKRGVHSRILQCVTDWYSAALSSLAHPETWEDFRPSGPTPTAQDAATLADSVQNLVAPDNKGGDPNKNWVRELSKLSARVRAENWEEVASHGLVSAVATETETYYDVEISLAARAAIEPVVSAARRALLSLLRDRNSAARNLLTDFDRAYTTLKHRRGVLRFDDVPRTILAAGAHGRTEDLYFRLDAKIRHLLLDEFQDTSLDQFQVLKPILHELASTIDGSTSVLCVGDVKQSIYSWRGGEPRLLPAIPERWPQFQKIPLAENRRSSPAIIRAVNAVFTTLGANDGLARSPGTAAQWADMFEEHKAHKADLPGLAQFIVVPDIAPEDEDNQEEDPEDDAAARRVGFIAAHAAAIAREAPSAAIAILTRTNKLIPRLILALRERGLPAVGEHGNPLTDTPAAAAAISALHLADHPGDTAALFHLALTPIGPILGLTWSLDENATIVRARQIASRLRTRIARDGIPGFLRWLEHRLGPSMDRMGRDRFDQLIDLAEDSPGLSPGDLARLARERPIEAPPHDGDPIRIMTIHKAKGLEFDAVILPELDTVWRARPESILTDRKDDRGRRDPLSAIAAVTTWPSEPYQCLVPELRDLCDAHTQRQHVEELCLLYVAMTRAKRRLDMITFQPPAKPDGQSEKSNSKPKAPSAARILLAALAPGKAPEAGTIWRIPTRDPWHHDLKTAPPVPPAAMVHVRLTPAPSIPAGRLARTSPSSLEGGDRIQLADLWRAPAAPGEPDPRDRGTAFHAMFELIHWLDDGVPTREDLAAAIAEGSPTSPAWVPEFLTCLRGDIGALLSRARYKGRPGSLTIRHEWSFAIREPVKPGDTRSGEHILNGSIDRLVIGEVSGKPAWAEIIDFKSDAAGDDAALGKGVDHYRPQLNAYRRAVAAMLSLPLESVSAVLAFSGPGRIVPIGSTPREPPPPDPFPDSLFPPPAVS